MVILVRGSWLNSSQLHRRGSCTVPHTRKSQVARLTLGKALPTVEIARVVPRGGRLTKDCEQVYEAKTVETASPFGSIISLLTPSAGGRHRMGELRKRQLEQRGKLDAEPGARRQ